MKNLFKIALLSAAAVTLIACGGADSKEAETKVAAVTEKAKDTAKDASANMSTKPEFVIPANSKAAIDMVMGDPNAPVTLIEYASTTCPGCAYFHKEILPGIKTDFIETGQVKLEFREFPTNPQQLSVAGFAMSRCAADEKGSDAYFAMLDTLFANQRDWVSEQWKEELTKYAAQAGMTFEDLKNCFGREDVMGKIDSNIKIAVEKEVSGTPSFFLNGEVMEYDSYENFKEQIAAAVEAAK